MKTMVSPSLLSANFIDLKSDIEMINKSEADWLHLDVMDGVFVPNISFGFPVIEAVSKVCTKPLDVHFMIQHPENYIEQTAARCHDDERALRGLHPSAPHHPADSCSRHEGRSYLNPSTPVCVLKDIICAVDMVLLMSVNPGFGGQKFIENTIKKIGRLRQAHQRERKPGTHRGRWRRAGRNCSKTGKSRSRRAGKRKLCIQEHRPLCYHPCLERTPLIKIQIDIVLLSHLAEVKERITHSS